MAENTEGRDSMKKYLLLAALLVTANAQAARLQCDLEDTSPTNQTLYVFTLEVTNKMVKVVDGRSGVIALDMGDGWPVTVNGESGIIAVDNGPLTQSSPDRYASDLTLNRHSLRVAAYSKIAGKEHFWKGQCYQSDPKF